MTAKRVGAALSAIVCLAAAVAASGQEAGLQKRTIQLNADLTAQVITLGRDASGMRLSASIKITNTGEKTVFLIFLGRPSAIDDVEGSQFTFQTVSGVAYCDINPDRLCIGIPDPSRAYPLQAYTEVDAGRSITVLMKFALPFHTPPSTSPHLSLTTEIAYRIVESPASDAELSDRQKLKDIHLANLSFDQARVSEK